MKQVGINVGIEVWKYYVRRNKRNEWKEAIMVEGVEWQDKERRERGNK